MPWILQHSCFTIDGYFVHSDDLSNCQRRWGVKYDAAVCNFGKMVLGDVKHITYKKLAIRNQKQKIEGMWIGKSTSNGEHIISQRQCRCSILHQESVPHDSG
eukprot:6033216-Amphidinium_carterae.2